MKIGEKDRALAGFEEEISTSTMSTEQELNLTRRKLAVASKVSKEVLAKVDEKKVKINLNDLGKRGIARQANVTEKFTAKTADLKQREKITEEEKRKS